MTLNVIAPPTVTHPGITRNVLHEIPLRLIVDTATLEVLRLGAHRPLKVTLTRDIVVALINLNQGEDLIVVKVNFLQIEIVGNIPRPLRY